MACRRSDRRNFIGCNLGDVAIRGCGRGCCPYPESRIFEESHPNLKPSKYGHEQERYSLDQPGLAAEHAERGRTDLRWKTCGSHDHRPKFICLSPNCRWRRVFKPFIDEQRFEYRIDRSGWHVRPLVEQTPLLQVAIGYYRRSSGAYDPARRARVKELIARLDETEREQGGAWGRGLELWKRIADAEEEARNESEHTANDSRVACSKSRLPPSSSVMPTPPIYTPESSVHEDQPTMQPLSITELTDVMSCEPQLWWQDVTRYGDKHMKRCPGCGGKGTLVGSNFRVPAKDDDRAWAKLSAMAADGIDLNAHFVYCATVDEHNEMAEESNRLRRQLQNKDAWQEEKSRRIEEHLLAMKNEAVA